MFRTLRFRERMTLTVLVGLSLACLLGGCPPVTPTEAPDPAAEIKPVLLVDTERLAPPAVTTAEKVYRPEFVFDLDAGDPARGQALGCFITVAADDPQTVELRVSPPGGASVNLVRIEPLDVAGPEPAPPDDTARDQLAAGAGLYWLVSSSDDGLEHRFAVVLPRTLLEPPAVGLEMYASVGDDGTPLGGDRLELTDEFFYLAIIGDSIQWGNGLLEQDKMSALVTTALEQETGRKVIRQRYAHSGARIVPAEGDSICTVDCSGEVPTASTSITVQVDLIERPELIDLVLMDGCINDVGVGTIISPLTTEEEIIALTQQFCDQEMGTLLHKVRRVAPQADIIVTGYFQIVSEQSDLFAIYNWLGTIGVNPSRGDDSVLGELRRQSIAFRDTAHQSLQAAIDRVNAETGAEQIAFANPGFGPENAVFAPQRWLWSLSSSSEFFEDTSLDLEVFPEDPMQGFRLTRCLETDAIHDTLSCLYSSIGHPNPTGAAAYATAIINTMRTLGVLPADN